MNYFGRMNKKMRLFNKLNLDERQLMIRGNIYYQALSLISALIIVNFYVKTFLNIQWAYGEWDYLLILFIGLLWIFIRFIICDIYPLSKMKYRILFIFLGCYGFGFGGFGIYQILTGDALFIENGAISNIGAFILFAGIYAIIFLVYIGRIIYTKYFLKGDEE